LSLRCGSHTGTLLVSAALRVPPHLRFHALGLCAWRRLRKGRRRERKRSNNGNGDKELHSCLLPSSSPEAVECFHEGRMLVETCTGGCRGTCPYSNNPACGRIVAPSSCDGVTVESRKRRALRYFRV